MELVKIYICFYGASCYPNFYENNHGNEKCVHDMGYLPYNSRDGKSAELNGSKLNCIWKTLYLMAVNIYDFTVFYAYSVFLNIIKEDAWRTHSHDLKEMLEPVWPCPVMGNVNT